MSGNQPFTQALPNHRFELELRMGANTFDDLMFQIQQLDYTIRDRPGGRYIADGEEPDGPINIISSTPYRLEIRMFPDVTKESYAAALEEWLRNFRAVESEASDDGA